MKGKHLIVFLFLILCPYLFGSSIPEPTNVPRFAAMNLVLLAFFALSLFSARRLVLPAPLLLAPLLLYYALNLAGIAWAVNSADAIYESQKVMLAIACIIFFLSVSQTDESEKNLIGSAIALTAIYAGYTIYELLRVPQLHGESLYAVRSFSEHRNLLGSLLFILMGFCACGAVIFGGYRKVLCIVIFFTTLVLILLLQVRSVYFAVFFALVAALLFTYRNRKMLRTVLLPVLGALLLVVFLLTWLNPEMLSKLNVAGYQGSITGLERLNIWGKTLQLISDHPLWGIGPGNWQYNYSRYQVGDIDMVKWYGTTFQRPHNDFLWIASETGVFGLLCILFIIFIVARSCFSYEGEATSRMKVYIFAAFLSGLMADAFFSFDKERITHIVFASLMFALLLRTLGEYRHATGVFQKASVPALLLLVVFNLVLSWYRIRGEYFTQLLVAHKKAGNARETIDYGHRAVSAFYLTDPTSTPIYSYIGWAYNVLQKQDSMAYVSELAYRIAPYDHEALSNFGFALERQGRREEARAVLSQALRIQPYFEATIYNLVVLEYNSGNYREAYRLLCTIPGYQEKHAPHVEKIRMKAMEGGNF